MRSWTIIYVLAGMLMASCCKGTTLETENTKGGSPVPQNLEYSRLQTLRYPKMFDKTVKKPIHKVLLPEGVKDLFPYVNSSPPVNDTDYQASAWSFEDIAKASGTPSIYTYSFDCSKTFDQVIKGIRIQAEANNYILIEWERQSIFSVDPITNGINHRDIFIFEIPEQGYYVGVFCTKKHLAHNDETVSWYIYAVDLTVHK